jgi:phosphoribosylanthranilate isomerase
MTTRVKICGVMTPEDAVLAAEAGADAIGLNFYSKSPRSIDPRTAMAIVDALPPFTSTIGVFVDMPFRHATALGFQLGLRGIQDYADTPPIMNPFPFAHIPAFRVKNAESLAQVAEYLNCAEQLNRTPSAVLIDSFVEGAMGGTGHPAPWHLLADVKFSMPLILAGGLTPENVTEAIRVVKPWGVDVASGVESSPGRKDHDKLRAFIERAKSA